MLNVVMVFSLAVFSAPSGPAGISSDLAFHEAVGPRQTLAASRMQSEEAARAYDELRSMPASERTDILAQMPATMQSAIWTRHLLTTLVQHPELTAEQRAVIQEAFVLLRPELFDIDRSNPRWTEFVDLPLRRLKERAIAAFPNNRTFARELFTQLGSDVPAGSTGDRSRSNAGRPRLIQSNATDCSCSVTSDWCDTSGLGFYYCKNAWCMYKNKGCGTWLQYPCEGLCYVKGT